VGAKTIAETRAVRTAAEDDPGSEGRTENIEQGHKNHPRFINICIVGGNQQGACFLIAER